MRKQIGIFVVPKFKIDSANGGAENMCRLIALGLTDYADVVIFHSENDIELNLGIINIHNSHIISTNAFYLDDWICDRGEVSPDFCSIALELLEKCSLLISFERVLANVNIPQICVLGGISYIHCEDVAMSSKWKKLIVPSGFIKNKCSSLGADVKRIEVISNGINCYNFYSYSQKKNHTALLPFRPDIGKGFFDSIDFISKINKLGKWGKYHIIITRQDNNDFSDMDFYDKVDAYALNKEVHIEYVAWGNENTMNSIYNICDFILSLGYLEEGFGLTTIESILAGRYVIAKRLGATQEILPDGYGVLFVDNVVDDAIVECVMSKMNEENLKKSLLLGDEFIRKNYDVKIMQKKYCDLIFEMV